jgi:hypothetical protein
MLGIWGSGYARGDPDCPGIGAIAVGPAEPRLPVLTALAVIGEPLDGDPWPV